jgi:hypothetical protein
MRFRELITEGKNVPCIVVDVQPAHASAIRFDMTELCRFLAGQNSHILMFVNADDTGTSDDNVENDIYPFWEEHFEEAGLNFYEDGLNKMTFEDKGYGYLRGWMDQGVSESVIVKTIREMYQQKVTDSRELFDGDESEDYVEKMSLLGVPEDVLADAISVKWTSVSQLKKLSGAYIMGGGRNECLREVELLMNAFNIKYKRIEKFVY